MKKDVEITVKGFPKATVQEDYFYWYIDLADGNGESFYEKKNFSDVKMAIREKIAHPVVEKHESWIPLDEKKKETPVEDKIEEVEQKVDATVTSNNVDEAVPAGFTKVETRNNQPATNNILSTITWKGWTLIAALVIVIAMAVTCPDENAHRKVIEAQIEELVGRQSNSVFDIFGDDSMFSEMIKTFMGGASEQIAENIEVKDYFLFSVGELDGHRVSLGIMNHIYMLVEKDDISKYLNVNQNTININE